MFGHPNWLMEVADKSITGMNWILVNRARELCLILGSWCQVTQNAAIVCPWDLCVPQTESHCLELTRGWDESSKHSGLLLAGSLLPSQQFKSRCAGCRPWNRLQKKKKRSPMEVMWAVMKGMTFSVLQYRKCLVFFILIQVERVWWTVFVLVYVHWRRSGRRSI